MVVESRFEAAYGRPDGASLSRVWQQRVVACLLNGRRPAGCGALAARARGRAWIRCDTGAPGATAFVGQLPSADAITASVRPLIPGPAAHARAPSRRTARAEPAAPSTAATSPAAPRRRARRHEQRDGDTAAAVQHPAGETVKVGAAVGVERDEFAVELHADGSACTSSGSSGVMFQRRRERARIAPTLVGGSTKHGGPISALPAPSASGRSSA